MNKSNHRYQHRMEISLQCVRCGGLRVPEMMQDGGMRVLAYRCIHCGDITDQKILIHRQSHDQLRPSRPRTPVHMDRRWQRRTFLIG